MTSDKKIQKISILLMFFIVMSLFGCLSPWQGDNASFVISFAGVERAASSRNVADGENSDGIAPDFLHRIELTRGQEKIIFTSKTDTIEAYAPEGKWTIWVYSYLDGELFALGDGEIDLQVGQMNEVTIKMHFVGVSKIPITSLNINITQPVKGMTPSAEARFEDDGDDSFTAGAVSWSPEPENSKFKGNVVYTATVTLTAADGFTFIGLDTATINYQVANITDNTGTDVTLSYTFPVTNEKTVSKITIETPPTLTYTHLDNLDLTGLVVKLEYDDDSNPENVTFASFGGKGINTTPAHDSQLTFSTNNGKPVTVSYGTLNVTTSNLTVNKKVINNAAITVTPPVKGVTPSTTATANGADSFTVGTVSWSPSDSPFLGSKVYTATVTLTAVNGFTFTGLTNPTINGQTATVTNNNDTTVTLSYTFAVTSEKTVISITIKTQPTKLSYTHLDKLNLDGLVVTLKYDDTTAEDVSATNFASKGITATPANNSELKYPTDNAKPVTVTCGTLNATTNNLTVKEKVIDIAAIGGVTPPATGNTPVVKITDTAQYKGTVAWFPQVSGTFAPATDYTATITLTAETGYTLQGVGTNFFTVAGVTGTATNSANSGSVTAKFPKTASIIINIADIPGVTPPVNGAAPVKVITETAQYTGSIAWSDNPTNFAPDTAYTATITLTAKQGYTFTGVAASFFKVTGTSSPATNAVNSNIVTATFPKTALTVINLKAIPGVTAPANGATAVTSVGTNDQYTGTVSWFPSLTGGKFAPATEYTATISLTANQGYTLQGVGGNFFTVANATTVSNSANSGSVTAKFPATAATVINTSAIGGVTVPATGATPVTTITDTTQYSGTVSWNPTVASGGKFASAMAYTATITLTAKAGYTLQGVGANFFTVAGATTVSNTTNSGVITAVFPKTATTVNTPAIGGVTPPATGATPVTAITDTTQYSGTVSWNPTVASGGTFAPGIVYTATITLTAKSNYTLQGVTSHFFTVAGVTGTATNSANTGVVTAKFPATVYNLGDTGPGGGKIFYYDAAGFTMTDDNQVCHYLEAAPNSVSSSLMWASSGYQTTNIPGTFGTAIGTGRKNTALILAIDTEAPAAKACNVYSNGGKTDWFLPSKDELNQLYVNEVLLNNIPAWYWSSSQSQDNLSWSQYLGNGSTQMTGNKTEKLYVRAIRAF
jgi:hypothetical protein